MKLTNTVPAHIAIIMDGNRRWARAHGLPVLAGHQKVSNEMLEPLIEYAARRGVRVMTFWAFSTENWQREKSELEGIMHLFRHVINNRWQRLHEKGVRVRVIGDIAKFPLDIRDSLHKVIEQTKDNTTITAVFALNYGGRDELIRAIRNLRIDQSTNMRMQGADITQQVFETYLDTAGIPDPDMIVRTSGEQRLSGFLPWQSVYSELYFPSWYMPEFTPQRLDEVIEEYSRRKRRFGT